MVGHKRALGLRQGHTLSCRRDRGEHQPVSVLTTPTQSFNHSRNTRHPFIFTSDPVVSDCRFGVSPVTYPDPDPDPISRLYAVLFLSDKFSLLSGDPIHAAAAYSSCGLTKVLYAVSLTPGIFVFAFLLTKLRVLFAHEQIELVLTVFFFLVQFKLVNLRFVR